MTNLQLAICDAERNGDIDITTRNNILDIIDAAKFKEKQDEYKKEYEKKLKGLCAKESVDHIKMSIYEKELLGEISIEERETLLNRLDYIAETTDPTRNAYRIEVEVLKYMKELRGIDVEKPSAMHQVTVIFLELLKIPFNYGVGNAAVSIASGQRIAGAISFAINLSLSVLININQISMVKSDAMKIYNGLCTLISKTDDQVVRDRWIAKKEKMGRLLGIEA